MQMNRKEKAEITRQIILDAAEAVFFESGLSGATLEAIAQQSGVTRGAIYWHFTNKLEVLEAVYERTTSRYDAMLVDITEKATSLDELELFCVKFVREVATEPDKQRVLSILMLRHERLPYTHKIIAYERESSERMCALLTDFLKRVLVSPAGGRGIPMRRHAEVLQFFIQGMLFHYLKHPETINLTAHAKTYMRLFFDNLRAHHLDATEGNHENN